MKATIGVMVDGDKYEVEYSSTDDLAQKLTNAREAGSDVVVIEDNATRAALHGAGQGLTFGGSDELYGAYQYAKKGNPLSDWWDRGRAQRDGQPMPENTTDIYRDARDKYRNELSAIKAGNPVVFTGSEMAAGMLVPAGVGGQALRGASRLSSAGRGAKLAASGALAGGAAGVGYSTREGLDALQDAPLPALLGGAGTAAASYAAPAVGNVANRAWRGLTRTADENQADIIASHLASGGRQADDITRQLDDLGQNATLADIDPKAADLAYSAGVRSDEAARLIEQRLGGRQAGAQSRIVDAIDDASGTLSGSYKDVMREMQNARAIGGEAYESFIKTGQITGEAADQIKAQLAKKGMRKYLNKSVDDFELQDFGYKWDIDEAESVPIWILNDIKRTIDRVETSAHAPIDPDPLITSSANTLGNVKRGMVAKADNPRIGGIAAYGPAREGVSGPKRLIQSLKTGRDVKANERAIEKGERFLSEGMPGAPLSAGENSLFRLGVANRMASEVNDKPGEYANYAQRIYKGDGGLQGDRLTMVAQSPEHRASLSKLLDAEDTYSQTRNAVSPATNSATHRRQAADSRFDDAASTKKMVVDGANGGFAGLVKNLIQFVGVDDDTAVLIADTMTKTGNSPAAIRQLMERGTITRDVGESILREMERGTGAGIVGAASPLLLDEN